MKTAISLPDDLFAAADALAGRLGLSRSRLVATALAEFVAKHEERKVTERLDAVYESGTNGLDPAIRAAQRRSLDRDDW